ncbi:MAG: PDZ domain-containing protein [Lachnospiraceae bacterium]|nr:PDZ domain-containing protein [Lachnospiraceae bacterium]
MNPENNSENSYEFIQETIKKRPLNKRRIVFKTLFTVFLAVLFGVVACFTYVLLLPRVQGFITANDLNAIRLSVPSEPEDIPEDVSEEKPEEEVQAEKPAINEPEPDETEISANVPEEKPEEVPETVQSSADDPVSGNDTENPVTTVPEEVVLPPDSSEEENTEPALSVDGESAVVTVTGESVQAVEGKEREFEINDYTLLYQKIGDVADNVKNCIVTVTALSSDSDWFQNTYESKDQTSGVILADNGKELLILARTSVIQDADDIQITFSNGKKYSAALKKSDRNTDLSVVAVELEQIDEDTKNEYSMAELGNSRSKTVKGKPVIAIGDPLGVSDSIAIGQITSGSVLLDKTDSNVSILTTDIYGSTGASGILCDFDGKVLGIICHDGNTQDIKNLIRAYSISDIKSTIEKILNGQDIAYLGIEGTDVTDDISDAYGIPRGAYVKQVVSDSPAMKAGIQNGDVIIKLGTNEITSFDDYKEAMLKCQPKDTTAVTVKRLGKEEYVDISYEVVLGKL